MSIEAATPPSECDLAVVGGGILGLAVARELAARHPGARICVLESETGLGRHQTGHSSGVIHAGIYYEPGSLKARLCVEGARALYEYCEREGIPYRRSGKLIVATDEGELGRLDELERRGRANGVPGLRRLGADEIAAVEPARRGGRRPALARHRSRRLRRGGRRPSPRTSDGPAERSIPGRAVAGVEPGAGRSSRDQPRGRQRPSAVGGGLLRRPLVGPAGRRLRRARRPADRPLPRRLPAVAGRRRRSWSAPTSTPSPTPTCRSSAPT